MNIGNLLDAFWSKVLPSLIVIGVAVAIYLALKAVFKRIEKSHFINDTDGDRKALYALHTTRNILRIAFIIVVFLILLQLWGINVSMLIASLGLVSAVVAFALQDVLKDFMMGFRVMADQMFVVGDVIIYKEITGIVESFNVRTTKIRNIVNDELVILCNRDINTITIPSRMTDLDLSLSYEEDVHKIHKTLTEICRRIEELPQIDSCEYKGTQEFSDSAIIYKLRYYCDPAGKPQIKRDVLKVVQEGLLEVGIEIPYQAVDIHIKQD